VTESRADVTREEALVAADHVAMQMAVAADNATLLVSSCSSVHLVPLNTPFSGAGGTLQLAEKALRSDQEVLRSAEKG
jgi:hypothetical protein